MISLCLLNVQSNFEFAQFSKIMIMLNFLHKSSKKYTGNNNNNNRIIPFLLYNLYLKLCIKIQTCRLFSTEMLTLYTFTCHSCKINFLSIKQAKSYFYSLKKKKKIVTFLILQHFSAFRDILSFCYKRCRHFPFYFSKIALYSFFARRKVKLMHIRNTKQFLQ